jgi:ribonucleoside-triphosphate reductase
VGLNELARGVIGSDLDGSQEAMDFGIKVLTHIRHEAERLTNKHKVKFLLGGQSGSGVAYRFARLDLRFFGEIAEKVVCGDAAADAAYYTDGARLCAASHATVHDRVRMEGSFHEFGFIGAATEVWIGEDAPHTEDVGRLISQAFYQSPCAGLLFCPEFIVCSACGETSPGLLRMCPTCGSDRIDGLAFAGDRYGLISAWDASRLIELRDRRRVTGAEIGLSG